MIEIPNFTDRFAKRIRERRSNLIVGLDPQLKLLPAPLLAEMREMYGPTEEAIGRAFFAFNRATIDATRESAGAYKPQRAFFEEHSHWTEWAFQETVKSLREEDEVVIEDCKRGDGGDTAEAYASGHIGERDFWGEQPGTFIKKPSEFRVDCITVQPGIADACILPFVQRVKQYGTGIFVVTKSSFKPNSRVEQLMTEHKCTVWEAIAMMVSEWGNGTEGKDFGYRNVGVVMGATYDTDAPRMREILPTAWFLIPGFGGQGGTAEQAVVGIKEDGLGGGVNSSRGVIYAFSKGEFACDPAQFKTAQAAKAKSDKDALNEALKRAGKWTYN